MDAETVQAIAALAQQADRNSELTKNIGLQNGKTYTYRHSATEHGREIGDILAPPRPQALNVTTLTGFVDALVAGAYDPAGHLVHVEDYLTVSLKERSVDPWGVRTTHVKATHTPIGAFSFGTYYSDLPRFIIALQASFLVTDELLYVIRLASNLKAGTTIQSEDNGLAQIVTVKTGEVSSAELTIKPRIKLVPMRTFPEAAPVESEFLIRFQQNAAQAPSIGLFDVSGKVWEGQLMGSIKTWLSGQIDKAFPIIA